MPNFLKISILFVFCTNNLLAQQLPIFTQYQEMQGLINPAAVGSDYLLYRTNLSFGLSGRMQWIKSDAAPQTQVVNGSYLYENSGGISWLSQGFLMNDKVGRVSQKSISGSCAGIISGDLESYGVAIGIGASAVNYSLDLNNTIVRHQDDTWATTDQSFWYPDFSLGASFFKSIERGRNSDYFYTGISVPQIFGLKPKYQAADISHTFSRVQHIYANLGYIFAFDEESSVEISTWAKYVPVKIFHQDFHIRGTYKGNYWAGAGVGTAGFVNAEIGFRMGEEQGMDNPIKIGYSFETPLFTSYNPISLGTSHEINLRISFKK